MNDSASNPSRPSATDTTPPVCPSCHSTATVTTATRPDADTYWRCTTCGDVWNVARSHTDRYGAHRWR
jgi:transposase-like protein